ncbi:unnamed protein product (macronuclear) [Paramecium tetraurelia]|uniref:Uncharacterized protein n=1 Tax=Paramecium tetraurelia TaxID=5888 RepID=A0BFS8_PARTE|nr:uncharacterized protein GSPATT00028430001 [Paramecium tetraurelia]CAK57395.1 unnamed protein product [Paramecium tetraurelia]|eukprot:XP_001424793.1 hypothetical protein (macronuclear) [Paramecium tetraurelia strain d4-2]
MEVSFKNLCPIHKREIVLFNSKENDHTKRYQCLQCFSEINKQFQLIPEITGISENSQMIQRDQGEYCLNTAQNDQKWLFLASSQNHKCMVHSQNSIIVSKNNSNIKKELCLNCIVEQEEGYCQIQDLINYLNNKKRIILDNALEIQEYNINILKELKDLLLNYKIQIQQNINKFFENLEQHVTLIGNSYIYQSEFIKGISCDNIDLMIKQLSKTQEIQTNFIDIKENITSSIQKLQAMKEIQDLYECLNKLCLQNRGNIFEFLNQFKNDGKVQLKIPQINCKNVNSYFQKDWCDTIEFDQSSTRVIHGSYTHIKYCQFKKGEIKFIKSIHGHEWMVTCLKFMQKSDTFFSGGRDSKIKLWSNIAMNNKYLGVLAGHSQMINCIITNQDESQLISSSDDSQIKVWSKLHNWKCIQTISNHKSSTYGLSLSESGRIMISCGKDGVILVLHQEDQGQIWKVVQTIKEEWGRRISFIGDNRFTFQSYCKDSMCIFDLNQGTGQFIKIKEINVAGGKQCSQFFNQQYVKSKSLLLNKNCMQLNIMIIKEQGDCHKVQALSFITHFVYGIISNDGEYLITWNQGLCEITIWKLDYLD